MMKSKLFILCFLAVCQVCQANFLPVNLKVNGLSNPVGIDTSNPTFSWQTESDERGFLQSAYELVVRSASGAEFPPLHCRFWQVVSIALSTHWH